MNSMPQIIPSMFGDHIALGKNDCLENVNAATIVQEYDEDASLYELRLKGVGYYFIYDRSRALGERVEYFVRYRNIDLDPSLAPAKAVRQVLLWRDKSIRSAYSANVTKQVFWERLFPRHGCLASDKQQTDDGQRFWSTAVGTALDGGLTVRIVNTNDRTFVDVVTKKDFKNQINATWGTTTWFQRMVVLIFKGPLVANDGALPAEWKDHN